MTLGKAGVNISEMQVARRERGGDAIMVLGIDSPAPLEAINQIARLPGMRSVKPVYLETPDFPQGTCKEAENGKTYAF